MARQQRGHLKSYTNRTGRRFRYRPMLEILEDRNAPDDLSALQLPSWLDFGAISARGSSLDSQLDQADDRLAGENWFKRRGSRKPALHLSALPAELSYDSPIGTGAKPSRVTSRQGASASSSAAGLEVTKSRLAFSDPLLISIGSVTQGQREAALVRLLLGPLQNSSAAGPAAVPSTNDSGRLGTTAPHGNASTRQVSMDHLVTEDQGSPPPDNDPPQTTADTATVDEDGSVEIDVTANDSDPDGDDIYIWSWDVVTPNGQVAQTPEGKLKYTPDPDFNGYETFSYKIVDNWSVEATGLVTVTVTSVNDDVAAFHDAFNFGAEYPLYAPLHANALSGLLKNDIDFDRTPTLTVNEVDAGNLDGTIAVSADGSFDYWPTNGFYGLTSITYNVTDGQDVSDDATAYIWVRPGEIEQCPINEPDCHEPWPVAVADSYAIGEGTRGGNVVANDTGVSIAILDSHPAAGRMTQFETDGSFEYAPEPSPAGELFGYRVYNGEGDMAQANVQLYGINVDIFLPGPTGTRVDDKIETTVGSFTVANLNNTDGDKNPDGTERIDKDDPIVAIDPNSPACNPRHGRS